MNINFLQNTLGNLLQQSVKPKSSGESGYAGNGMITFAVESVVVNLLFYKL